MAKVNKTDKTNENETNQDESTNQVERFEVWYLTPEQMREMVSDYRLKCRGEEIKDILTNVPKDRGEEIESSAACRFRVEFNHVEVSK